MKRQWKGFIAGIIVTFVLGGIVGTSLASGYQKQATLDYTGIQITLDGQPVTPTDANGSTVEPFAIEGTTYLPVRGIANALGLGVEWDGTTQTVKLTTAAQTPANQTGNPSTPPASGETIGQKNALKSANSYLSIMPFSREGLIEQLEFEQYSHEDAVFAAVHCCADWYEQAAKSAKSYLDIMSFSRDGLIDQLEFEGYTHDQAVYGAQANGY